MLLKYGGVIADGRGKLNGQVVSRSPSGKSMSNFIKSHNPGSRLQMNQRYFYAQALRAWPPSDPGDVEDWQTFADSLHLYDVFGDLVALSGFSAFVMVNINRLRLGLSMLSTAPAPSIQDKIMEMSLQADLTAAELTVQFSPSPVPDDTAVLIFFSPPVSPGISVFHGSYRYLGFLDEGDGSGANFWNPYVDEFGYFPTGKKIFGRFVQLSKLRGLKLMEWKVGAVIE